MTLCGGVCEWRPGGGCRIKLSEPLLKASAGCGAMWAGCGPQLPCPLVSSPAGPHSTCTPLLPLPLQLRPSSDLKMVLLHEMIHAHCMLGGACARLAG